MFVGMQKVEYAIIHNSILKASMLFPHVLKIVNISPVPSWQEELYILSTSDNPSDIQIPEPAEIFSIVLFHSICPSFPYPWMCVELVWCRKRPKLPPRRDQAF